MFQGKGGPGRDHHIKGFSMWLAGGGFKLGEHKVYPEEPSKRVPAANLLLSILQNHGLEIDRFGTSTGSLPELGVTGTR